MERWIFAKYFVRGNYAMMQASEPSGDTGRTRPGGYGALEVNEEVAGHKHKPIRHENIGPAPNVARFYRQPKTYMTYAILVTLFCCPPLGIPAIYYTSMARRMSSHGELLQSQRAAVKSRQLIQMALSIGLVMWFVTVLVIIIVTHPKPL